MVYLYLGAYSHLEKLDSLIISFLIINLIFLFVCFFLVFLFFQLLPFKFIFRVVLDKALCSVYHLLVFYSSPQSTRLRLHIPTGCWPFPLLSLTAPFSFRGLYTQWLHFPTSLYFSFCANQLEEYSIK